MFGYVKINKMDLTFREYEHYRSYYCGLCKCLKREHGEISRFSLNYDITFLIVLLSAIYNPESKVTEEVCIANPMKKKKVLINEITEYAAAMNVLLTYYKLEDNVNDDGRIKDKIAFSIGKSSASKAKKMYPEKAEIIKKELDKLAELERNKSTDIDEVSNTFGRIMGEIFAYKNDEYEVYLRDIGFNIGKYIYTLDAYEDLEEDLKKGRYNPFVNYSPSDDELKKKVDRLISICLGMASKSIDELKLKWNIGIIDNIMFSGVYLRYKNILYGEKKGSAENVWKLCR
ncbi:hypothetical protein EXD82_02915 [Peptacetobacter hominis]|uniref:Uncharacterized protein n=1 Tax=Peptacetobacter hominis TaxID=2743610 RepID=A0A544QWJ0_9FIRM|nr:DUF5685 family protein [Peptacetobacter hominis]TQQ85063.1 hypothetical protein EXD82_02915 [Peptacetobacter hominis]